MTWHNRNLYLIGLPGAGKTAIGRELAELLPDHEFVDLDREIERVAGASVAEIFAEHGEAAFRERETAALLREALPTGRPKIIATGGGIVMSGLNRSILRGSGIPIWIDVTIREAARNILRDIQDGRDRPLFHVSTEDEIREKLSALLETRRAYYEQATLHFVIRNPTENSRTEVELAQELITALDQMSYKVLLAPKHRTVVAKSALGDYPVFVGNGIAFRELFHFVRDHAYRTVVVVMDTNIQQLHWPEFQKKLEKGLKGVEFSSVVLNAGEEYKTRDSELRILELLNAFAASRRETLIVALGGGVITDLAGFAASVYHRGLPLVHIPTTLIAQADAAIGGKTGIDHFGRKNSIGTFYPPQAVIVDPLFLKTLPERERLAGLAEVLKYALIGNREWWHQLSERLQRLLRGVDAAYEEVIFDSIVEKLRYVEADEFERQHGVRELLNFGHTFGHALEAATNFDVLRHGEAVLLGMRTAAWLSMQLGHIAERAWNEIDTVLRKFQTPDVAQVDIDAVARSFRRDKKGENRVILLRAIGEAFATEISDRDARRAIEYMLTLA